MFARINLSLVRQFNARAFSTVNFSDVTRASLLESNDHKWVGQYLKSMSAAPLAETKEHTANIDEFMRKNFRKLTVQQALEIIEPISQGQSVCLDSSFWTWETLEEALRGHISELSHEEFMSVLKAFNFNYKGSRDFLDLVEQRVYLDGADV